MTSASSRKKVKITLGVANAGTFQSDTVRTIVGTIQTSKFPIDFRVIKSSMVHNARKLLVEIAQKTQSTHIFFVDSDMAFEDDVLPRLLAHDKDIIGANYNFRSMPLRPVINPAISVPQLHTCDSIGTGCLLIKMGVFDVIDKPWFWYEQINEGTCMTEDYWFCRQARNKGFKIWCDGTLDVRHIGDFGY